VAGAVEQDHLALATHQINFPSTKHLQRDVRRLKGKWLLEQLGIERGGLTGLIGGPPCQGFSDIGLRSESDPRNGLFLHFFRLVNECRPAFFLAENVPGILQDRNDRIREHALAVIPKRYKVLKPFAVRASEYGVPTTRTRVFFVGYDPDRVADLNPEMFRSKRSVQDVRVGDALIHLPRIRPDWQNEEQSWRAVGELDHSQFSRRITDFVPRGVGDPHAIQLYKNHLRASGFLGTQHSELTIRRFSELAPGKADSVSKCVRLDRDGYCPTLRAGTGADRGSYQAIRPVHPTSPRVIAPREAARLQGFPDWFQFHATKWHSFRQIGNSVSPIVAERILKVLYQAVGDG
jgi:DNA (cytosine-5)-methyltransferase 1